MNTEQQAYSIPQFCSAHCISRALFYVLLKNGQAPDIMKLGRRTLISAEAAEMWRKKITASTSAKSKIE